MLIELKKIPDGSLHVERLLSLGSVPADSEVEGIAPVEVDLTVNKDARGVVVSGRFHAPVSLACARCLRTFEQAVNGEFTAHYRPRPESFPEDVEVRDEDLDLSFLDPGQEELDLRQVILEQVLLALPMKPLHDPACRGLCPSCGVDRNESSCDCRFERADPRFAVLARLKATRPDRD